MLPQEFLQRMARQLGPELEAFLASYDRPRAVGLRLNPLKAPAPPSLPFALEPVPWAENGFWYPPEERPGLHPWHEAGAILSPGAQRHGPAELLAPETGMRVLDLCAAPGGKATQLAAKLQGRGLLVCNEYNSKRAAVLSQNIERMAVANALVLNETPQHLAQRLPGWFHRVLVDAPAPGRACSEGSCRLADWSPALVDMCARRQGEILDAAAALVAPGGRLVYSTCTFSPQENEWAVAAFLRRHPEFSIVPVDGFSPGGPEAPGTVRLWPHKLRGEGHYAALLEKTGGSPFAPQANRRTSFRRRFPPSWKGWALPCPRTSSGLWRELVLGAGRHPHPFRLAGTASRLGPGQPAGRDIPPRPRPGPVDKGGGCLPPPGPGGSGGLPGRGNPARLRDRLAAGHPGRAFHGLGKGGGRPAEKSLPKGLRRR